MSTDAPAPPGMRRVPGGEFLMGADDGYAEEGPARRVRADAFWMDRVPVTNAEFARFVADTGHVTVAESCPDPADYPGILPGMVHAGSLVFAPPAGPVRLDTPTWWEFRRGAQWRHPHGPGSDLRGLEDHPVVHVAHADAQAYCAWAGKDLPTEAEWEFAARGGLDGRRYAWGDELMPGGRLLANFWHGEFPWQNLAPDGFERTSPVASFEANGYGLHDMIGNVWEWTADWYATGARGEARACCMPRNPHGGSEAASRDPRMPELPIGRKVLKGGSHLCAPNYCRRYRPAARYPQPVDTSTCHVGFRCVARGPA